MAEFLHMGGYAFYVWTSYAVVLVLFLWQFISPLRRLRELMRELSLSFEDGDPMPRSKSK